ncbi:Ribosomal protein L44-like, partial [Homarus americanus]
IDRPMELLTDILARSGCGKPEPRLMFQTGKNTVEAVYQVGIYSDKNFMGSAPTFLGHRTSAPGNSQVGGRYSNGCLDNEDTRRGHYMGGVSQGMILTPEISHLIGSAYW